MRTSIGAAAIGLTALLLAVPATSNDKVTRFGDLTIEDAWAREAPPTAMASGAFLTIRNTGESDDRLIAASSDISDMTELHTTINDDGVMKMRHVEAIEVPAGGTASLAPGGDHVMLMGLTESLVEGTWIALRLEFEQAGEVEISVPVLDIAFPGY